MTGAARRVAGWSIAVALAVAAVAGCAGAPAAAVPPTGAPPAAGAPARVGLPTRVEIPAIGVDAALVPVGLAPDRSMRTPATGLAAWYEPGPRPGAAGPAVVLAHVDSTAGPDVFHRLRDLRPGDRVTVHRTDGSATFVVEGSEQVDKRRLPYDRIWGATAEPVLRLITCGGAFDRGAGSYRDNVIVYARPAPLPRSAAPSGT